MSKRRNLALGVAPALMLAAMILPMVIYWGDLPDSMATHWDFGGTPNGHMPPTVLLLGIVGIFAAVWISVARVVRRIPSEAPSFVAGLLGIGGLLTAVQWIAVSANRDVADWADAGEFNGIHLLVVIAAALLAGLAGWKLAGGGALAATRVEGDAPMLELDADQTAVWSGRGRGWVLIVIGLIIIAISLAIWSPVSLVLLLVAVLVLMFAEVRATVSERGVVVSLGWLGVPSWMVPMAEITRAEVEDVSPMSYGGWGYRLRPGVRAVVVRGGPSLRLVRTDKADLVLTVDDPQTGAGLVNSLLARVQRPTG